MNDFATIDAWLRNTYNIGVSAEWLTACLEWIQQENLGQSLSISELKSQVYEQWLVSDLSEIGEPVLPPDVIHADKFELISNYPLQLLSLVDVGFPLYGQKQKLQGRDNPNEAISADKPFQPAWEPKPSRTLLLQLTDGHTHVQAMEYQQIKDLHHQLPSGCKLLLSGTLVCRRGMILLTPDSVQVMGGEVDALMEQNTLLGNIEKAMEKNREDEGKHARKDFSGQFIARGSDKKIDSIQKSFVKRERNWNHQGKQEVGSYSGISQIKNETKPNAQLNQLWMKGETRQESEYQTNFAGMSQNMNSGTFVKREAFVPSSGQSMAGIKREINSQATSGRSREDIQNVLKGKPKSSSASSCRSSVETRIERQANNIEWEDDADYSELFEDEMDLDEIDAIDTSLTASQENSAFAPQNYRNTNSGHFGQSAYFRSARNLTNQNDSTLSANKFSGNVTFNNFQTSNSACSNVSNNNQKAWLAPNDEDMDLFDDDLEIDEIADPTLSVVDNSKEAYGQKSKNLCSSNFSVQTKCNSPFEITNNVSSSKAFPFLSKPSAKTIYQRSNVNSSDSEKNNLVPFSSKFGKSSPVIPCQNETTTSSSSKVTSPAVTSSLHAQQPEKRTPLFKTNSNSAKGFQKTSRSESLECNPPKKAKQCKLHDMFSSNSTSSLSVKKHINDVEGDTFQKSSSLSQKNSSLVTSGSSARKDDVSSNKVASSSAGSQSNFLNHSKQDVMGALLSPPRAVIHPYKSSAEEGIKSKDDLSDERPYRYLSELSKLQPPYSVVVKAYISTLTDKLGSDGGTQWTLGCRINDGTACVDVDLSNTLLTELIGFSAQDSKIMRQRIKTEPQVKEVLMEGLSQCQLKLINISCLMEVEVTAKGTKPVVKNFTPLTRQHVTQLLMKVERQLESVK